MPMPSEALSNLAKIGKIRSAGITDLRHGGTGADGVGSGIGLVQVVSRQFMDHGDQLTRAGRGGNLGQRCEFARF